MQEAIKITDLSASGQRSRCSIADFDQTVARQVNEFHASFPEYCATPLASLPHLAQQLGVQSLYVKDESFRFGLNAFKVLGGSYAIGQCIAKRLGYSIRDLPYDTLTSTAVRNKLGALTFVTATDGNHGRGIAWTAHQLGQKSVVYMPKGSSQERLRNIQLLGADASITEWNYDGAVAFAAEQAQKNGWIFVQDTAWSDYEEIPRWIMQGYTSMALEAVHQLGTVHPTHVFLQAGVGAMAGAVTAFLGNYYSGDQKPTIVIVEPNRADCIYRTAKENAGALHCIDGDMDTIMAGLACGQPCSIAWEILRDWADYFVSMPDWVAANGMRILGAPSGKDPRVISGESGAAGFGLVTEILRNPSLESLKMQLGLDQNSVVLCISTEGSTDQENYRRIVWDGGFPAGAI